MIEKRRSGLRRRKPNKQREDRRPDLIERRRAIALDEWLWTRTICTRRRRKLRQGNGGEDGTDESPDPVSAESERKAGEKTRGAEVKATYYIT